VQVVTPIVFVEFEIAAIGKRCMSENNSWFHVNLSCRSEKTLVTEWHHVHRTITRSSKQSFDSCRRHAATTACGTLARGFTTADSRVRPATSTSILGTHSTYTVSREGQKNSCRNLGDRA
jgi:hypothetical protein